MVEQSYIRFVLGEQDANSHRKRGVLVAAAELRDSGVLDSHEHEPVVDHCRWFNDHLNVPACLSEPGNLRALSWFKGHAAKPIARMWELVFVIRSHGVNVEMLKTSDPGIIVYEDKWQVVAKPRRDQRRPW